MTVRARVNTDRKQINETIYDPDSKVERSVRTVKESSRSQDSSSAAATTVTNNIPQNGVNNADGKQSNDENKKNEELTNYEMSSKTVTTVSGGYNIEHLSVAVLINRSAFAEPNKEPPKQEAIDRQLKEIEQLISSAAGLKKERGDALKVTAVDFMFNEHEMTPVESPGFVAMLGSHLGSILNMIAALGIAALVVIFGLAPARRALLAESSTERTEPPPLIGMGDQSFESPTFEAPTFDGIPGLAGATPGGAIAMSGPTLLEDISERRQDIARRKLEELIQNDEAQAAAILKQWMRS